MKKSLLFTIVMALLCLFGNVKVHADVTPGSDGKLTFNPDRNSMWIWTGTDSPDFTDPNNWDSSSKHISTGDRDKEPEVLFPRPTDKVYIPKLTNGYYPNINGMTCDKIYIAAGAMVLGQYGANINEWYTDVVIPTNCWVLFSSPLKATYSGDLFTDIQGGKYVGPFAPSIYDAVNGNGDDAANRVFPSSVYQRLFSTFASSLTNANYYIEPISFESEWSTPTNALGTEYKPGLGVQVLARDRSNRTYADFHLPSQETTYYFFTSAGNQSSQSVTVAKQAGDEKYMKPAYVGNNGIMNVTVERDIHNASNIQDSVPPTFAVGNPAFARMSVKEFLKINFSNGNTAPYLYKHNEGSINNINGSETIYYYDDNKLYIASPSSHHYFDNPSSTGQTVEAYIERDHGFMVMAGDDKIKPIETRLIGTYNMEYDDNEITWSSTGSRTPFIVTRSYNGSGTIHNPTQHTITISATDDEHYILINNFAGLSNVRARISQQNNSTNDGTVSTGTLTIEHSTSLGNFYDNSNTPHELTLHVAGNAVRDSQSFSSVSDGNNSIHTVTTEKLKNLLTTSNDLTIAYRIENNVVTLSTNQTFAAYPSDSHHYYNGYLSSTYNGFLTFRYTTTLNSFYSTSWNIYKGYQGNKPASDITEFGQDNTVKVSKDKIDLTFTPEMFDAPVATSNAASANAPRRTAAQGSTMASINTQYNNKSVNTLIKRSNNSANGYKRAEDAAIFDLDNENLTLATLAGSQLAAINSINDTTAVQLYMTGVNGDVDLVFDNLAALGENVRLFDANDSTYTPLNGSHATTTVTFGVNDSPLRYSLVWDYTPIIAGNETLTAIDFTAFSPAKGEVKVMSNELLKGVRVYNAAGQLITSNNANANEVSFSNLLSGIYVIEAYTANGKATKKVDVK